MKTQPAKLLMALLLGLSSSALITTSAFADDSEDSSSSSSSSSAKKCSDKLVSACGLQVIATTCTGTIPSSSKDKDGNEETDDDSHKSKDSDGGHDRKDHEDSHADHHDRSHESGHEKISICHRMGGAEKSLTVANDGYAGGHSRHALDTIGRCEDFNKDKENDDSKAENDKNNDEKDRENKSSLSDAGYSIKLKLNQIACLKGSTSSHYTINGTTYSGGNLNSSNVSVRFAATGARGAGSTGGSGGSGDTSGGSTSTRGGARTLH